MKTVIKLTTDYYDEKEVVPIAHEKLEEHILGWREKILADKMDNIIAKSYEEQLEEANKQTDVTYAELMDKYNSEDNAEERDIYDKEAIKIACKGLKPIDTVEEVVMDIEGTLNMRVFRYEGEILETQEAVLDISEKECIIKVRRIKLK